jgi:serine/threonine protein kinase
VPSSQTCTECGALIRDGAALGLCSLCALRSALSLAGTQEGFDFTKEIPRTIHADYELLEEIGRGGRGVVFRARQKSLNRIVALKVFPVVFSDPTGCKRLLAEVEVAARLRHPNM